MSTATVVLVTMLEAASWITTLESRLSFSLAEGTFELHYQGDRVPVGDTLCYRIEGYSETCLEMPLPNLISGMRIRLIAPNVPYDLLGGYTLLIRFPDRSDATISVKAADERPR